MRKGSPPAGEDDLAGYFGSQRYQIRSLEAGGRTEASGPRASLTSDETACLMSIGVAKNDVMIITFQGV
jgi:hypothetical protein